MLQSVRNSDMGQRAKGREARGICIEETLNTSKEKVHLVPSPFHMFVLKTLVLWCVSVTTAHSGHPLAYLSIPNMWNSSGTQWVDENSHSCTPLSTSCISGEEQVLQLLPCNPSLAHWFSSWKLLSLRDLNLKVFSAWKECRAFLVSADPLEKSLLIRL